MKCALSSIQKGPRIQYTVCDLCGKKYRRKMDMLQHKKDDHMYITKEEVAALERLKFLYDKKGNNSQQAITSQVKGSTALILDFLKLQTYPAACKIL